MRLRHRFGLAVAAVAAVTLAACSTPESPAVQAADAGPEGTPSASASPRPSPSPSRKPKPKPKPTPKPSPKPTRTLTKMVPAGGDVPTGKPKPTPSDGVPLSGARTFTTAPGVGEVVGTGVTLVTYRVQVENGITWGANEVWTPDSFSAVVQEVFANPRSWIASAASPITDPAEKLTDASWSFQRVDTTKKASIAIRLATPNTVDKLCGAQGVVTEGQYSCRYANIIMINLRRWLKGVAGFATDLPGYRNMVINHETGHFLGFDHMLCPGAGQPAPVMQTQTIALAGCAVNPYPFLEDNTFVTGPWAPS